MLLIFLARAFDYRHRQHEGLKWIITHAFGGTRSSQLGNNNTNIEHYRIDERQATGEKNQKTCQFLDMHVTRYPEGLIDVIPRL